MVMRLLRLDLGSELGTVDLHPFMSQIHSLRPDQREALINAVRAITTGSRSLPFGLVEVDGQLTELQGEATAGIGPFTTEDVVLVVDDLVVGEFDLPGRVAELDQARKQAQIDAVYVEETRADLVPSALADVQRLKDKLEGREERDPAVVNAESRIETVARAVDAIRSVPAVIRETPPEVSGLVGRWDAYKASTEAAESHLAQMNQRILQAETALTQALEDQAEAKAAAVPVVLTAAEDARLTELSTESIDKRKRGRKNSDEEESEAEALLAKVGQETFASYVMYRMMPEPAPENVAALESATANVAAAKDDVEEARTALSADPTFVGLNAEFDGIKDEARGHLGMMLPDDLGGALEALVHEKENPEWVDLARHLVGELLSVGLEGSTIEAVDPVQLPDLADGWLKTARNELQMMIGGEPDREQLQADLEQAEVRFQRHARAMSRIDQREAQAAASTDRVRDLEALIARAEGADAGVPTDDLGAQVRRLADQVRADAGAAVPLLLDGDFTGLGDGEIINMLNSLEPMAQEVQLILLTERDVVNKWVGEVGLRRALQGTMVAAKV